MADLVKELNSLDFSNYIGGPLQAAIEAQKEASMTTVNFIQEVGLDPNDGNKVRYVDFVYKKQDGANGGTDVKLSVPFITMITVPNLRIDEITIDFNARLTSVETSNLSTKLNLGASLSVNYSVVKFKASASYQRATNSSQKVEKSYNLAVHVRAVQDEMPAGLERLLDILENAIKEADAPVTPPNNGN